MTTINLNLACIEAIDISPARIAIERAIPNLSENPIRFEILFPRDPNDPRELSEVPEIRLWFIRLDAAYPWLPYILDWKEGELTRYAAMLIPHSFSKTAGIEFNPEALQIFVMQKIFVIQSWLRQNALKQNPLEEGNDQNWAKLQQMSQALGYEIDSSFFKLL
jgi:hypothetical protein